MSKLTEVKILYRHPDPKVRKLPAKALEYKNGKGETEFYLPETVDGARGPVTVYAVPVDFARRLLANQPERYFLQEPAELVIKRKLPGGLSSETIKLTNELAAKLLLAEDADAVAAKAKEAEEKKRQADAERKRLADEEARREADEKARRDRDRRDQEEEARQEGEKLARKAKADEDALRALESADLDEEAPAAGVPTGDL